MNKRRATKFIGVVVCALTSSLALPRAQAGGEGKSNFLAWLLVPAANEARDAISTDGSDPAAWDLKLDGPVAASANHKIIYEDDEVRILLVTVGPGRKESIHNHRWPSIFVSLDTSPYADFNPAGQEIGQIPRDLPAGLKLPLVLRLPPSSAHAAKNLDEAKAGRAVRIEFKHGFPK